MLLLLLVAALQCSLGFAPISTPHRQERIVVPPPPALSMGLFDGIAKAFSNEDFKSQDQRVRASHILVKGDDVDQVLAKINRLMGELRATPDGDSSNLGPVFAEMARRESDCPSASKGGDLGLFAPGTMVQEFDEAVFPETDPPPPGSVIGPVITDFGCHIILVTQREENRDQVEEKLARIDRDARR